jgi:hypothetical protein
MRKKELVFVCEICQTILDELHHCKAICPNCGRMFDCSDLPIMAANATADEQGVVLRPGSDPRDWMPKRETAPEQPESKPASSESPDTRDLP